MKNLQTTLVTVGNNVSTKLQASGRFLFVRPQPGADKIGYAENFQGILTIQTSSGSVVKMLEQDRPTAFHFEEDYVWLEFSLSENVGATYQVTTGYGSISFQEVNNLFASFPKPPNTFNTNAPISPSAVAWVALPVAQYGVMIKNTDATNALYISSDATAFPGTTYWQIDAGETMFLPYSGDALYCRGSGAANSVIVAGFEQSFSW